MHWIDWSIVAALVVVLTAGALYSKKHMRSVAGFLAAERCAKRYLLTIASGMSATGAISIVAMYEMFYDGGFCPKWWELMKMPVTIIIAATGWMIYRFRQTRSLTVMQFLETRYSRGVRIYTGIIAFLCGVINFGLFPSVGARFFMYFCNIPSRPFTIIGDFQIDLTLGAIMLLLIGISLYFTFCGGQIAVIVTDFLQGAFFEVASLILLGFLVLNFSWPQISEALSTGPAADALITGDPEKSMVNPFKSGSDFNATFYMIYTFGLFYGYMSWQGSQGYRVSSISPHEQKMAGVVSNWKTYILILLILMVPICMYTLMHHQDFSVQAAEANKVLASIPNEQIRTQMTVPIALRTIIPTGLMGAMCAVMLAAFISTHDTYMHSWGSIFIQDVIVPFKKKPFEPDKHILLLRLSVAGVALFIFIFSMVYTPSQFIAMFFAITGAMISGIGAVMVGGLYWKRGSVAAAYVTLTTGAVLAISALVYRKIDEEAWLNETFNSQEQWGFIMAICIILYVVISLCGKTNANMDKILNRGKYAIEGQGGAGMDKSKETAITRIWSNFITKEFTLGDKILYASTLSWALIWFFMFAIGTTYYLISPFPDKVWLLFWKYWIWVLFGLSVAVTIWLISGGIRNLIDMFKLLKLRSADASDDGWIDHAED